MNLSFRNSHWGKLNSVQFTVLKFTFVLFSPQKYKTQRHLINWSRCKISFGVLWSFVVFDWRERERCAVVYRHLWLWQSVIYRCTFEEYFLFRSVYLVVYSFETDIFCSLLFCFSGLTLNSIIDIFVSEASIAILVVHGTGLGWRTWAKTIFWRRFSLIPLVFFQK